MIKASQKFERSDRILLVTIQFLNTNLTSVLLILIILLPRTIEIYNILFRYFPYLLLFEIHTV